MITIAEETLIFRRRRISRRLRLLVPTFLLVYAPAWLTPLPSQQVHNTLLPLVDFIKETRLFIRLLIKRRDHFEVIRGPDRS